MFSLSIHHLVVNNVLAFLNSVVMKMRIDMSHHYTYVISCNYDPYNNNEIAQNVSNYNIFMDFIKFQNLIKSLN